VRTIEKPIEEASELPSRDAPKKQVEEAIESPSQLASESSSKTLSPGCLSETPSELLSKTPSLEGEPKA
jgi:hypothetical protein